MNQIVNIYYNHIVKSHAFLSSPDQIETLCNMKRELLSLLQTMNYDEFNLKTKIYDEMFKQQQSGSTEPYSENTES